MRRILALAAVASLALTGLTGTPAAADNTIQVDPGDVVVNEVGVEVTHPNTTPTDVNYIEIRNTTMTTGLEIDEWQIEACDANGNNVGTTVLPNPEDIDDFRVAGDTNYNNSAFPNRDYALDGTLDAGGGVALFDDLSNRIHAVSFDSSSNTDLDNCLGGTPMEIERSPSPTDPNKSAQRCLDGSWRLASPFTPQAANPACD